MWLNPESLLNILAMSDVTDHFRVTMDSQIDNALIVHVDDKKCLSFKKIGSGLYMLSRDRKDNSNKKGIANYSLNLVSKNKAKYTRR